MGTDPGGGPVPYILVNPCPNESSPLALVVSNLTLKTSSDEQLRRIALIQNEFAQRVSALLSRAYTDIAEVLRAEGGRTD